MAYFLGYTCNGQNGKGGALRFHNLPVLTFSSGVQLAFINNYAQAIGGAIFFDYKWVNVSNVSSAFSSSTFVNNTAPYGSKFGSSFTVSMFLLQAQL
jgi:predicted outer membrane repeat protein